MEAPRFKRLAPTPLEGTIAENIDNSQEPCHIGGMFLAHKRLLELETGLKQVRNDMDSLRSTLDSERVQLADLKEQAIRTINRLQQQKRREPKEPNGDPVEAPAPNPLAAHILRGANVVLPR